MTTNSNPNPKKHWDQPDAIAFIQEAADFATRAHDDRRHADVARALVTIADVAGAAALDQAALTMKDLATAAPPETVDFVVTRRMSNASNAIMAAVQSGRASLGMVKAKTNESVDADDDV